MTSLSDLSLREQELYRDWTVRRFEESPEVVQVFHPMTWHILDFPVWLNRDFHSVGYATGSGVALDSFYPIGHPPEATVSAVILNLWQSDVYQGKADTGRLDFSIVQLVSRSSSTWSGGKASVPKDNFKEIVPAKSISLIDDWLPIILDPATGIPAYGDPLFLKVTAYTPVGATTKIWDKIESVFGTIHFSYELPNP